MTTTTFRQEEPDRPSLTRAWLHQLDPALAIFDQIMDDRLAAIREGDTRPRCDHDERTASGTCGELAKDETPYCRRHQPKPACTGTTAGTPSEAPRPCKAESMRGYTACARHVEGEEKARYDREREELARAEAEKDARRAERKRKRDAATRAARS